MKFEVLPIILKPPQAISYQCEICIKPYHRNYEICSMENCNQVDPKTIIALDRCRQTLIENSLSVNRRKKEVEYQCKF